MSLTKSLHTITAVTNAARFLLNARHDAGKTSDTVKLLQAALDLLGYPYSERQLRADLKSDDTLQRCRDAVAASIELASAGILPGPIVARAHRKDVSE